ncbi:MAG: GNAT family N-acetyltransferase [Actinomycetota bacterium]|nr:GNAT family N-acetyltransferase [Actinomycetota bacterium]
MGHEIRPITEDELPAFARTVYQGFGVQADDEEVEEVRLSIELDRTLAIFDGGRPVATAGVLSVRLTLPGATTVPAAAVTVVAVLPTHRRRGMLTALMSRQLDDVAAAGEPVAVLLASESVIYGRFGYGPATEVATVEIERAHAAIADPSPPVGDIRLVEVDDLPTQLPEIHARYCAQQPGEISRPPGWWQAFFRDYEHNREGLTARFAVVYDGPGGRPEGYLTYRMKGDPWAALPEKILQVEDLVAQTPRARAALWRYCLAVDLVQLVRAPAVPVDEPLRWILRDSRRLQTTGVHDFLWVRLVDVAAALSARRYATADGLVFDVADGFRASQAGRYRLDGGPDGAECRRTDESADLRLDVADLGSLFLGGVRATTLARAGRIVELKAGALRRADALFGSDPMPYCSTEF